MGVRQYLIDALEQIDAGVFSGDLLHVPEERAELMRYMARWNREAHSNPIDPEDGQKEPTT